MAKKNISYSEAINEIEEILRIIENNDADVDLLTEKVKRACFLIKYCKNKLHNTETEVEKLFKELDK